MFNKTSENLGSIYYIKDIETKKLLVCIYASDVINAKKREALIIIYGLQKMSIINTHLTVEGKMLNKIAKMLFQSMKDTHEERIKEALNLFKCSTVNGY